MSSRPPVVAPSPSSVSRSVSLPGVSRPTLLVRRLRRGVGCPSRSSDRFRPVGRPPGGVIHNRQGTASCQTGSSPVPVISTGSHGGCLLRQHHSGGLSSQGGWHKISSPQHLSSGDLELDGVPLHPPGSAVPPGLQQRPRRRPVSPSPAPTFRVVTKLDRISIFEKPLAGPNRFICHLSQSSLFDLLLTIPGSNVSRHGAFLQSWEVAPHWAWRPWFSDLLQLSLTPPVVLPARQDLLRLPRSRHLYPDLRRLRLHAWRLSSDLPEPLASPSQ